jgi:hypothetical protein
MKMATAAEGESGFMASSMKVIGKAEGGVVRNQWLNILS